MKGLFHHGLSLTVLERKDHPGQIPSTLRMADHSFEGHSLGT